jgi:hypothetical protein
MVEHIIFLIACEHIVKIGSFPESRYFVDGILITMLGIKRLVAMMVVVDRGN